MGESACARVLAGLLFVGWPLGALMIVACNGALVSDADATGTDAGPDVTPLVDATTVDVASVNEGGSGEDAPSPDDSSTGADTPSSDSPDSSDGGCGVGEALCDGGCVSVQADPANCGACGHACGGTSCTAGICAPGVLTTGYGYTSYIAVSGTSLYWVDLPSFQAGIFEVSVNVGGGGAPIAGKLSSVVGLLADSENLYFSQASGNGTTATFGAYELSLDGGAIRSLGSATTNILALALNSTTLFYASNDGTIGSAPISGGAAATSIVTGQNYIGGLAADDNNVYWSAQPVLDGVLYQAAVDGGSVVTLATQTQAPVTSVAVDGTTVYFASLSTLGDGGPEPTTGIFSVPIGGGTVTRLGNFGTPVILSSTDIYFGQTFPPGGGEGIGRMAKTGGPQLTLTASSDLLNSFIALGPNDVYTAGNSGGASEILETPR